MKTSVDVPVLAWWVFGGIVAASLAVDLLAHRRRERISRPAAIVWSIGWVAVGVAFAAVVGAMLGRGAAEDYLTAYVVEKSLSVDNLFTFLVVFARLGIPPARQHQVLFWGIVGALVTRGVFIVGGASLLRAWHDLELVLGGLLLYTGVKTAFEPPQATSGQGPLRWLQRHLPVTPRLHGDRFLVREEGRRVVTPLLLALLAIEITDVAFAIDSIPAVFAVSEEPFIVYSSNVFAVLGMRALYLVLADLLRDLRYLHFGLAGILVFAGVKLLLSRLVEIPHAVSLGITAALLVGAIVPSVVARRAARVGGSDGHAGPAGPARPHP